MYRSSRVQSSGSSRRQPCDCHPARPEPRPRLNQPAGCRESLVVISQALSASTSLPLDADSRAFLRLSTVAAGPAKCTPVERNREVGLGRRSSSRRLRVVPEPGRKVTSAFQGRVGGDGSVNASSSSAIRACTWVWVTLRSLRAVRRPCGRESEPRPFPFIETQQPCGPSSPSQSWDRCRRLLQGGIAGLAFFEGDQDVRLIAQAWGILGCFSTSWAGLLGSDVLVLFEESQAFDQRIEGLTAPLELLTTATGTVCIGRDRHEGTQGVRLGLRRASNSIRIAKRRQKGTARRADKGRFEDW